MDESVFSVPGNLDPEDLAGLVNGYLSLDDIQGSLKTPSTAHLTQSSRASTERSGMLIIEGKKDDAMQRLSIVDNGWEKVNSEEIPNENPQCADKKSTSGIVDGVLKAFSLVVAHHSPYSEENNGNHGIELDFLNSNSNSNSKSKSPPKSRNGRLLS